MAKPATRGVQLADLPSIAWIDIVEVMGPPRIGIPGTSHGGLPLMHGSLSAPIAPVNPNYPQPDGLPPGMQPRAGYVITQHPPSKGSMVLPSMTYATPSFPQAPVPQPLIDQNQPPTVPTSPVVPAPSGSPYPQVPGPYYPVVEPIPGMTTTIGSFWDRYKKPILIGGGIAGGLGLIALIAVASSKRRGPAPL